MIPAIPSPNPFTTAYSLTASYSWGKEAYDKAQETQEAARKESGEDGETREKPDRKELAEQAKALMEGREKWKPGYVFLCLSVILWEGEGGGRGGDMRKALMAVSM